MQSGIKSMSYSRLAAAAIVVVGAFWGLACGGVSMQSNPATTVTLEITGSLDEDDREDLQEKLKEMTDGNSHSMSTFSSGDKMTINLSPVSDVEAFVQKLDFGEVTEVDGRTIKISLQSSAE